LIVIDSIKYLFNFELEKKKAIEFFTEDLFFHEKKTRTNNYIQNNTKRIY